MGARNLVRSVLRAAGVEVQRASTAVRQDAVLDDFAQLLERAYRVGGGTGESRAQLRQDLFVVLESGFKRDGSFVEFGATNGIDLSNTYLLETELGWTGILAEPGRVWHPSLRANRQAAVSTKCVWSRSGETLEFTAAPQAEFSTLTTFVDVDGKSRTRRGGETYPVETVSLLDLLAEHGAPEMIDYLSIDTEGSEFEILSAFDFGRHRFGVITCEHNFGPTREPIRRLLESNGYRRRFRTASAWDDWYVRA